MIADVVVVNPINLPVLLVAFASALAILLLIPSVRRELTRGRPGIVLAVTLTAIAVTVVVAVALSLRV